jgi:hypothetical protein
MRGLRLMSDVLHERRNCEVKQWVVQDLVSLKHEPTEQKSLPTCVPRGEERILQS